MNGPGRYVEAGKLVTTAAGLGSGEPQQALEYLAAALVNATLALVAVTWATRVTGTDAGWDAAIRGAQLGPRTTGLEPEAGGG